MLLFCGCTGYVHICVYVVLCFSFWDGSIMQFGLDQLENPVGTGMLFYIFNSYDNDREHDYDYHHEPYLQGIKENMLVFTPVL